MLVNISVNNISKTININEDCFVGNGEVKTVIVKLLLIKKEKDVINFDYAVD